MDQQENTERNPQPWTIDACSYLAGCRWPNGCDAENKCIGEEAEYGN